MPLKSRYQSNAARKHQALRQKRVRAWERQEDLEDIRAFKETENEPRFDLEDVKAELGLDRPPRVRRRFRR